MEINANVESNRLVPGARGFGFTIPAAAMIVWRMEQEPHRSKRIRH